jgi:DDB1- and CUL4-associated factor 13
VRDCLEVLRLGAGLDNGKRLRRGKMDNWKYNYMEEDRRLDQYPPISIPQPKGPYNARLQDDPDAGLEFRKREPIEPHLRLPPPRTYRPYVESSDPCDPDYPRVFHMFWTGPFTDKPYLALLSFLFTQNLGLHLPPDTPSPTACRPQVWLWINPGPAAAVPNPSALRDMFDSLKDNSWSAPFLHPRFKDVIKFKLWNTTDQLDGIPEIKDEWRSFNIFNSGGHVINVPKNQDTRMSQSEADLSSDTSVNGTEPPEPSATNLPIEKEDDMFGRTGSTSSSSYDRLSVILSDMARFILCHRFGGTYLDADTLFLRDWEELWGWKGAFAYRWSRLEKYNTAVLRMNKNSALGTFLFRTALRNELDFHPMTISRYTKDAYLEGLLLRLPDALFDSAWLNTEYYQRDRPPFPYFTEYVS